MRGRLSPELQKLIKRNPLPSTAETDRVLKGDLEFGATRYSVEAATTPAAWAVYFAIEGENGRSFDKSIASLHPSVCADLARWGFDEGRDTVGVVAYRRFLEMSRAVALEEDCARYVETVRNVEGEAAARTAMELVERRLAAPTGSMPPRAASQTAFRAVSVPPPPPKPRRAHAGFAPFPHPYGEHSLGGFDVSMPKCPACAATTRLWFCFDVEADVQLAPLRVLWSLLPLVGCGNCDAWRYRHDYLLDKDATELKLVKIWARPDELATILPSEQPTLPRQPVALAETDTSNMDAALQIGGEPLFVGQPLAPRCVTCNDAMVYVATLARSEAFDPPLAVVGVRHHFACMRCRTLAVIAEAGI